MAKVRIFRKALKLGITGDGHTVSVTAYIYKDTNPDNKSKIIADITYRVVKLLRGQKIEVDAGNVSESKLPELTTFKCIYFNRDKIDKIFDIPNNFDVNNLSDDDVENIIPLFEVGAYGSITEIPEREKSNEKKVATTRKRAKRIIKQKEVTALKEVDNDLLDVEKEKDVSED